MEFFNINDLPLSLQKHIVRLMDFKTMLNFSLCSKKSLEMVDEALEKLCNRHVYWRYYESCYLNNEIIKKNWRIKKHHFDDFYDRWYLRAFKRTVSDFDTIKEIGEGSFSVVWECKEKRHDAIFAVKQVPKQQVLREKKMEAIQREKDVLAKIMHPNIIRLFGTLVDEANLYFIFEMCHNKDCAEVVNKMGKFTLECARFYIAEVFTALDFLHKNKILHRDVKPENCFLDHRFHVKLGDFGCCIDTSKSQAKSFVGTAQYICPEMLKDGKNVSVASDYWSAGCTLYFFVCGYFPFKGKSEYLVMKKVETGEYTFPEDLIDENVKDLISKLLVVEPNDRYSTIEQIQTHAFFQGFDWKDLHEKSAPKPEDTKKK